MAWGVTETKVGPGFAGAAAGFAKLDDACTTGLATATGLAAVAGFFATAGTLLGLLTLTLDAALTLDFTLGFFTVFTTFAAAFAAGRLDTDFEDVRDAGLRAGLLRAAGRAWGFFATAFAFGAGFLRAAGLARDPVLVLRFVAMAALIGLRSGLAVGWSRREPERKARGFPPIGWANRASGAMSPAT